MISVLHLTAHLGGGVGKAITTLAKNFTVSRKIVCFEAPEKLQFIDSLKSLGVDVIISPSDEELRRLIESTDIVQVEWWNHPVLLERLVAISSIPMRLVIWCHVSGLGNPVIPRELLLAPAKFVFTSACSYNSETVKSLGFEDLEKLTVISSGTGFENTKLKHHKKYNRVNPGYMGTLSFSKLNPKYIDYLAAVKSNHFSVLMYGDSYNQDYLKLACRSIGRENLIRFMGYSSDPNAALSNMNLFVYLLNPTHYGTAENVLLEAMSMGIVPVVLNNKAESEIVTNNKTGFIVNSPEGFSEVIEFLENNPINFHEIGVSACAEIKEKYSSSNMGKKFLEIYEEVIAENKKKADFSNIFGLAPEQWFISCQGDKSIYNSNGTIDLVASHPFYYGVTDSSKGSAIHYSKYHPDSTKLCQWANAITENKIRKLNGWENFEKNQSRPT